MITVKLAPSGQDQARTQNPKHVFYVDENGFPRTKKA